MHTVALALTEGMPMFEFAVPCEVFGLDRSDIADPWYRLRFCGSQPHYRTAAGLTVTPDGDLAALEAADTVLVPAMDRANQLKPPPDVVEAVRRAYDRGARIVAICAGSYLLAEAGILQGRRMTTHWMSAVDFTYRYPGVHFAPEVLYVSDGNVHTSAGTGAAIDLCLHLVRLDHGAAVANEVARRMVVPPHREGGQRQFVPPVQLAPDGQDPIGLALGWALQRLHQPLTVADLAQQAHLAPRTFARHFRERTGATPLQWLIQQRVRLAQELLETTDEPVEAIATRTGFGTAAGLRQHFQKIATISPSSYRHLYRRAGRTA
ncbi:DJ-1/PfpI family protein [Kineosporia rhizophila]|uniref:GlxA family transcriptional regulator n=1 Tax=Kineosporia TaxID=49184 RepID=UPI001E53515E|nr:MULTISPECIES: DJ-1/PfpI family protein [Kineosporia]MCE0540637.1 DJ-1/PfpI family protein [Kineosporia rhizophila]GLY20207.1 AraC family transcriptional regulator [Kineosporia sp. NBRC 101677]